jgi:hypothetical protein
MFRFLKHWLGLETLESDRRFYQSQWTQIAERLVTINEHLVEIKSFVEERAAKEDKKSHDRHIDLMTRLGMVLTEIKKITGIQNVSDNPYSASCEDKKYLEKEESDVREGRQKR